VFALHKKKIIATIIATVALMLVLFCLPIKVKQAVEIELATVETTVPIERLLGHKVSVLCEYNLKQVTEPPDYDFVILAIENENGVFRPFYIGQLGEIRGVHGLYVYPRRFIGGAIRNYNFGHRNLFVLQGMLSKAPAKKNGSTNGDYRLTLDSWDIVYPVYHWEFHFGPNNEFYRKNLFIFDYLIP